MRQRISNWMAAAPGALALVVVVVAGAMFAPRAEADCNASKGWFEKYTAATDAQKKGDYAGALSHAKEMLAASTQACEKQTSLALERSYAYSAHNWAELAAVCETITTSEVMSPKDKTSCLKQISDAQQQLRHLDKALPPLREYVKQTGGTPADWNNLAELELVAGNCPAALAAIDKATGGKNLGEKQLLAQSQCYFKSKDTAKRGPVIESLAMRFPKKGYYTDLVALYRIAKIDDRALLNIYRLGYQRDWLTESDDIQLYAKLADASGATNEALRVLDKSAEKKRITLDDKLKSLQAQEKRAAAEDAGAVAQLDKESQAGKNGDKDVKVGMMYFGLEQYPNAVAALQRGLAADHVQRVARPDDANMALGIALARQKKFADAEKAFNAAKTDARMAKAADLWLALMK